MTINELPDIIRQRRLEMGLSQDALAKLAGTNHATVSEIETRRTVPNMATVDALCRALGLRLAVEVVG